MALIKFAESTTNITNSKLNTGIQSGTACNSGEVNGAIRQNSIVTYALAQSIGANELTYNMPYESSVSTDTTAVKVVNSKLEEKIKNVVSGASSVVTTNSIADGAVSINKLNSDIKTALSGYNSDKSIEQRLSELGFKQATITNVDSNFIDEIECYEQGKIVALQIKWNNRATYFSNPVGTTTIAKITDIEINKGAIFGQVFPGGTYKNVFMLQNNDIVVLKTNATTGYITMGDTNVIVLNKYNDKYYH